jgi:hypothetical protein
VRVILTGLPTSLTITGPVAESLPTYSGGTTYGLGDRVLATDGTTGFEYIYESASAGNTGHSLADPAWWIPVSAANPWRMFDQVASSQTTSLTGSIFTSFTPDQITNTISLLNIVGDSATVEVVVSGSTVYSRTISLSSAGDGVTDWYQYFFGNIARRTDALFTDLPSYAGQQIRVTLTGTNVAIGTLGFGYGYDLGTTTELSVGIDDYSKKQADQFGNYQIVQRAYAKNGSFTSVFPAERFDDIAGLLPKYRATPAIWIGDDDSAASYIYGFYSSHRVKRQDPIATLTLDIKGLT